MNNDPISLQMEKLSESVEQGEAPVNPQPDLDTQLVSEHNLDETAHPIILEQIDTLRVLVQNLNAANAQIVQDNANIIQSTSGIGQSNTDLQASITKSNNDLQASITTSNDTLTANITKSNNDLSKTVSDLTTATNTLNKTASDLSAASSVSNAYVGTIKDSFIVTDDKDGSVYFADSNGFISATLDSKGTFKGTILPSSPIADKRITINKRNADNLAYSQKLRSTFNSNLQRPTGKYNHFIMYGQSLSTGYQGWPALSKTQKLDNLMIGNSVRPLDLSGNAYTIAGSSTTLNPLVAVSQKNSYDSAGATILSDTEVSALAKGDGAQGESSDVAATNMARKLFLQYVGLESDSTRLFVSSNTGVPGRTIEHLSKSGTGSTGEYNRIISAANLLKNIANTAGGKYRVPVVFFMQGEDNYTNTAFDGTKDGYKAKLKQLYSDISTDLKGITGQTNDIAFIMYQTGGSYTRDNYDLGVGMAQFEMANEVPNVFMAGPVYPYTDKGGHMDPNGYRWFGHQLGKVFHKVVMLGEDWKPLHPRNITVDKASVLIDFHVPYPPLAFGPSYQVGTPTTFDPTKGFKVIDSNGSVDIAAVDIVADTIVEIKLTRETVGTVKVQYACADTFNGNGNLRDSDPTLATDNYEYTAGSGQWAETNISELVGKPYPLYNWCIAFSKTV